MISDIFSQNFVFVFLAQIKILYLTNEKAYKKSASYFCLKLVKLCQFVLLKSVIKCFDMDIK
jgi:hypothetical protein